MSKNFNWAISHANGGHVLDIEASNREEALARAGQHFLWVTDYEVELVGEVDAETGMVFQRSPIPDYTAKRIRA